MTDHSASNKRIAKNTAMLYFRMLFTMAVGLYTSRIVLEQLGVDDYGIYNVIGGVVAMFSIISASLSSAISRFLTYELGKGNESKLKIIFSTAILIQIAIGLVTIIIGEILGVWFLNNKMTIAPDRLDAANWVLQLSLITFLINMVSLPYNAAIIAHERMQAFAYISFLEAFLKLCVAFLLYLTIFDSLKTYAVLITIAAIITRYVYSVYCKRNFKECSFHFIFDKQILKGMLSFSSWNFIGSASGILKDQGVNVLINIFCGPAVNAARGICVQINNIITSFSNNFMIAINPQIIKSYAIEDFNYMMHLIRQGARFSFYLLLLLSLPIILETPFILKIWLTTIPEHTVNFVRLILCLGLVEVISLPLQYANQATGKIKTYQLIVGGLQMLNFPFSFLLLKNGFEPEYTFLLSIIISLMCLSARLCILRKTIKLNIKLFISKVCINIFLVSVSASILPIAKHALLPSLLGWGNFVFSTVLTLLSTVLSILYVGCNTHERKVLKSKIKNSLYRLFHHA